MQYDWILFDADETIFRFDAFLGLQTMLASKGMTFTADDFTEYQKINKPAWVKYQNGEIDVDQLKYGRFVPLAKRIHSTPQLLQQDFLKAMSDICVPLPGAKELLEALRGHVKLGIVTNGFVDLQQARLEKNGLYEHFDVIVCSEAVGCAKPDPRIFEYALKTMGHPDKQRVLMVGDNPHSDILGGMQIGFDTCWLNENQEPVPEGITPTLHVTHLEQLHRHLFAL